jgi:CheY-like chemotaxis protein
MPHRGAVVMLVDSIVDEMEMYAEALLADGFRVTPCEEPSRALAEAIADPPDVVVTRIMHAGASIDGLELTRRLKNHPRTRLVPVVIITSRIEPELRAAAAATGCDEFLLIPCLPEALIAVIKRVLSAASSA